MDLTDILSDAFTYPLSDFRKLLMLGLPYLVLGIITLVLGFQVMEIGELADETLMASAIGPSFVITLIVFYIVAIVATLIMSGISISVIRETVNQSDLLPDIDLKNNIVDGLKSFVVVLIYIGIPIFILSFLFVLLVSADTSGLLIGLFAIIILVVTVLLSIVLSVALGRLAETGSLSESLNFKYIFELSKNIGIGKIFITNLICIILLGIIGLIGSLLQLIPFIGFLLVMYILYTYNLLVTSRTCGLLYRERNGVTTYNNMYQQPINNGYNQQQYNQQPEVVQNNQVTDFNSSNNYQYDFHPENHEEVNDVKESVSEEVKICSNCGYTNPDFVNICVNCGKKL